ncbi:hypothetical protein DXG03_007729 [Asterophora parasitica]|uniref:F-box domain-containing protein n=1 Tax=Asterophora parasitica TaxID=117018 RepID=A0A9P7GC32_9AGAR|nr:hypothetical protein DXG03_007729 [Asterophora parasitica]
MHNNLLPNDPSADKSRHLIDQEMQRLEDAIRLLKSRRNILAPISRLPPEMLAKVFSFRAAESVESSNPLEWIRVSHVSRHWRAIALDSPSLWGNLVFTRPKWSEEMLKRSKMASLIVKADLTCITPRIFEAVRLALLHGPRIHDLQLRAASATIERLLSRDLELFEAPMIHSLSLSVPRITRFGSDEGFTIPSTILSGETPYLRRLDLDKCNISWESALLQGLTHLKIHDVTTAARPTTQQLVDALERMPRLEVLDFRDALPLSPETATSDALPEGRIIDLPVLNHLAIVSTVPECSNLIRHISVPTGARVHLSCSGTETSGSDFSGIMKVVSNPRSSSYLTSEDCVSERKIVRVLHVLYEAPLSLVVRGWSKPLLPNEAHIRATPDIQLHLSWHHSAQTQVDDIATSLCKSIPIAHLRSLRLSHVGDITRQTWTSTFGLLPHLHNVHIAGGSMRTFIAALHEQVPSEVLASPVTPGGKLCVKRPGLRRRPSALPIVYFPHLTSLTIEEAGFEHRSGFASPFEDLRTCLMERSERKVEIQELRLRECSHLYEENVNILRELVAELDWDGIEEGYSDEEESVLGDMGGYIFGGYNNEEDLGYLSFV